METKKCPTCEQSVTPEMLLMQCDTCGKRSEDVSNRQNAYANDVGNDPDARHTVCDECDYQNRMDI